MFLNETSNQSGSSILDAVSHSQQSQTLRELNPQQVVFVMLNKLSDREKYILTSRYGLQDGKIETLETIGQKLELTRERVRQIEKEAITKLKKQKLPQELLATVNLITELLTASGGAMTEQKLIETLLPTRTEASEKDIVFVFQLSDDLKVLKESKRFKKSWYLASVNEGEIKNTIEKVIDLLRVKRVPLPISRLFSDLKNFDDNQVSIPPSETFLENFLTISKQLGSNIFGEWGLSRWPVITPKDVGDKAYMVLKKNGEPQHYHHITTLINKQKFDNKTAQQETVHNELIKDRRFVLVGRGIYALKEWGYKKGTVADIIESVLIHAGKPLSKEEVVKSVLEQRMVKRNTVIVGLSNKSRFSKTPDNKYQTVEK